MNTSLLGPKGLALLRVLDAEIRNGKIKKHDNQTFLAYSEALALLGVYKPTLYSGRRLQAHGLTELNEWTRAMPVPKIAGLIVNKKSREPSSGYAKSHGVKCDDSTWKAWWLSETAKAIDFDWLPYLG